MLRKGLVRAPRVRIRKKGKFKIRGEVIYASSAKQGIAPK